MILYFSATGNCKYVAERIAKEFNDQAVSIEKSDGMIAFRDNEMFGLVTPVHWWGLPVIVREFIRKIRISSGKPAFSFVVTTYGTSPGFTFKDAKKELAPRGINLQAGYCVKMPDIWTPMFDLSNPEEVKRQNEEAEKYIDEVLEHIRKRDAGNLMIHRQPYIFKPFTDKLLDSERKTKNFHVEEQCIGCGLCAKRCPAQAIEIKDKHPVWIKSQCYLCLRCLHSCPKFAIQYGNGKTKQHGQYKNPNTRV